MALPAQRARRPISDTDYDVTGIKTTGLRSLCNVAADGSGHVYASKKSEGPLYALSKRSGFSAAAPGQSGTQIQRHQPGRSPSTLDARPLRRRRQHDHRLQQRRRTTEHDLGAGAFSGSRGVAVNAPTSTSTPPPSRRARSPNSDMNRRRITRSTTRCASRGRASPRRTATPTSRSTPDGRFAVFAQRCRSPGYENLGHPEIYRYDVRRRSSRMRLVRDHRAPAKTDTGLSPYGLNLTDDGRVFFTSAEGLVLSDTNEKQRRLRVGRGAPTSGRSRPDAAPTTRSCSPSARTASTPSSSPGTFSSPRTKTAAR